MERKFYQPTEKQDQQWHISVANLSAPSDDEFKAQWAAKHRGKTTGWGMLKRDYMLRNLRTTREYNMGIWQGRVDAARGLDYSEERNDSAYNLGYYTGYVDYHSNRRGWDRATRERFDAQYVNC